MRSMLSPEHDSFLPLPMMLNPMMDDTLRKILNNTPWSILSGAS
jgi:hypothetical protein